MPITRNPDAIEELRRILYVHSGLEPPPAATQPTAQQR